MADIFLLAVAAAFYPTLLAFVIVVLGRPGPARLLAAFLAGGMLVGIASGCIVVFALGGTIDTHSRTVSPVVDLVAGALALALAAALAGSRDLRPARVRRARAKVPAGGGPDRKRPSWPARAMRNDSPAVAFALGVVLDLPSVWYLVALKDIATGGYSTAESLLLILAFNLVMFTLIELPLVAYVVAPERSRELVTRFNAALSAHRRQVGMAIAGTVGLYLVIRGIAGLL